MENLFEERWEEYLNGTRGSFMRYLSHAFQQADSDNLEKLYHAFPAVGKDYMLWQTSGRTNNLEVYR